MSIENSFDINTEEIVKPSFMVNKVENFPDTVVVTFKERIINLLKENYEVQEIAYLHGGWKIPIYKVNYKGKEIAVYQTLIGAAGTAGLLEETIAIGGKKFIFFGSCGTLEKEILRGHFVIPNEAYRDEGVSYHYAPSSDYIKVENADKLANVFEKLQVPYVTGKTWTTDAIYRETKGNMMLRKQEGCIVVDMECSAIAAIAELRKIDTYQFFYGADTLDGEEWQSRGMLETEKTASELYYLELALKIAKEI